jgi:hypothetical protein
MHAEERGRTQGDNVQPEAADTIQNKARNRVMGLSPIKAKDKLGRKLFGQLRNSYID